MNETLRFFKWYLDSHNFLSHYDDQYIIKKNNQFIPKIASGGKYSVIKNPINES